MRGADVVVLRVVGAVPEQRLLAPTKITNGAVEMQDLTLMILRPDLKCLNSGLNLDNLQVDLVDQRLRVPAEVLELLLRARHRLLQADLELMHVCLDLRVLRIRLPRQPGAEVGCEGDAIVVLKIELLQGINALGMVGEDLFDIQVMRLLLLAHPAYRVRELLEAGQGPQRPVVSIPEALRLARLMRLRPRGCSGRGSNARRRPCDVLLCLWRCGHHRREKWVYRTRMNSRGR